MSAAGNGRIVVLDMAGTTVIDDGAVEAAFLTAIAAVGIRADAADGMLEYVRRTMGQSKIAVFSHLLDGDARRARSANAAFEQAYAARLDDCRPVPGAVEAMAALRDRGDRVVLATGFSPDTQRALVDALGWQDAFDLAIAPSPGVRGRPYPDIPLTALLRLGGKRVGDLVVVGDTTSDVVSGTSAGAGAVLGVLTGAHDRGVLLAAGADAVLESIADLPTEIGSVGVRRPARGENRRV